MKRIASIALAIVLALGAHVRRVGEEVVKIAFTDAPTLSIGDMTIYHPSYAAMLAFKGSFEKYTARALRRELYPFGTLGDAASNPGADAHRHPRGRGRPADGALAPFLRQHQVFSITSTCLTAR
jgi:hypothetical protein